MKQWVTEFKAIRRIDGELITYGGPNVPGLTLGVTQAYCDEKMPWLTVLGELVAEIPCKEGTHEAEWDKMQDFENESLN